MDASALCKELHACCCPCAARCTLNRKGRNVQALVPEGRRTQRRPELFYGRTMVQIQAVSLGVFGGGSLAEEICAGMKACGEERDCSIRSCGIEGVCIGLRHLLKHVADVS